ncbi:MULTISPECIES: MarR family winged helix-turn-helix transcriptional regulator [unclassified Ligilactobacillus]|uniref:MarR family winged helix-turn-helix transcriptional regulator n=1 Tax=unclassified Ligilactobacillus TaxID=2767920 RepID=UPI003853DE2E
MANEGITKQQSNTINDLLFRLYDRVRYVEDSELKKSPFSDITARELHLIHVVSLHDKKPISRIARQLNLTKGTLTKSIDQLERKGYVERIRSKKDRRVINIGLTKKGRVLYRAHNKLHQRAMSSLLSGMDKNEVEALINALQQMSDYFETFK